MQYKALQLNLSTIFLLTILSIGYGAQATVDQRDDLSYKPVLAKPWLATLSLGPMWTKAGDTQTFYLAPGIEKTYSANRSSDFSSNIELFVGVQQKLHQSLNSQLGIAVAATDNAKLSGHIWDDADPQFDNYKYHYQIRHSRIALKAKLLADLGYTLTPWVGGSLGVGFNRSHAFENTPLLDSAIATPNFTNFTQTTMTYSLSFGLQKQLSLNWHAGIGYEFTGWGKSQLDKAQGQAFNNSLKLSHLYTHGLLFNISYSA